MENVQHFPAQLMENVRHSPGRQQYHREAFFQASYSKERGCTSKTRRRISRKQMESLINEMFERIADEQCEEYRNKTFLLTSDLAALSNSFFLVHLMIHCMFYILHTCPTLRYMLYTCPNLM